MFRNSLTRTAVLYARRRSRNDLYLIIFIEYCVCVCECVLGEYDLILHTRALYIYNNFYTRHVK